MKKFLLIPVFLSLGALASEAKPSAHVRDLKYKKVNNVFLEAAKKKQATRLKEIDKVSKGMETLFLKYMIEQMRKTVPDSEFVKRSNGEKIYQNMLDDEYAKLWSRQGGIGLSDIVARQLGGGKKIPKPQRSVRTGNPFNRQAAVENKAE